MRVWIVLLMRMFIDFSLESRYWRRRKAVRLLALLSGFLFLSRESE